MVNGLVRGSTLIKSRNKKGNPAAPSNNQRCNDKPNNKALAASLGSASKASKARAKAKAEEASTNRNAVRVWPVSVWF